MRFTETQKIIKSQEYSSTKINMKGENTKVHLSITLAYYINCCGWKKNLSWTSCYVLEKSNLSNNSNNSVIYCTVTLHLPLFSNILSQYHTAFRIIPRARTTVPISLVKSKNYSLFAFSNQLFFQTFSNCLGQVSYAPLVVINTFYNLQQWMVLLFLKMRQWNFFFNFFIV